MEQARRDLMEADEKLVLKREEEKENRVVMDAKWLELREKEMLLKESFISFNKVNQSLRRRRFVTIRTWYVINTSWVIYYSSSS